LFSSSIPFIHSFFYYILIINCRGRRRKTKKSADSESSEVEGVIEAALSMDEPELDSDGLGLISDAEGLTDGDADLILGNDSVNLSETEVEGDMSMAVGEDDDSDTVIGIV